MKFQSAPISIVLSIMASSTMMTDAHPAKKGGGGHHGGQQGAGVPGFFEVDYVSKTCDAAFACKTHGCRADTEEDGIFVCRETYNPITGASQVQAKCIASDKAFETDGCGCCGEDCPEQPDFQSITCENQEDIAFSRGRGGGRHGPRQLGRAGKGGKNGVRGGAGGGGGAASGPIPKDAVAVCRELYDPFTGILTPVTIPISPDHSLPGDTCGCCDDECPEQVGSQIFERPDQLELDWCAADDIVSCTLPKRHGRHGRNNNDDEEQGVFVCRSRTNMVTGAQESRPLCIPTDHAWETDDCGCCGEDCPIHPEQVDIDCSAKADQCERRNGQDGVFVCRDLYHPLDGNLIQKTLCIDSERAWATDDCGCCPGDDGCPTTPKGGFATEDEQLLDVVGGGNP